MESYQTLDVCCGESPCGQVSGWLGGWLGGRSDGWWLSFFTPVIELSVGWVILSGWEV